MIDICINLQVSILSMNGSVGKRVNNVHRIVQNPGLPPYTVKRAIRGTHQPMNAVIKGIALSLPGRTLSAGHGVHFQDFSVISVQSAVNPCRETSDPAPYYDC